MPRAARSHHRSATSGVADLPGPRVLLIADEVMTGAWRTGPFLAADHDDVVPDLVTLEGIGVGLQPASRRARGRPDPRHDRTRVGFVHGTHAFNPISAAAGVAALERHRVGRPTMSVRE